MKTGNFIKIITKDFLPPVCTWLPSFLFSVVIVLSVAVIVRLSNKKGFRAITFDKISLTVWTFLLSYILVIVQTVFLSREPGSREAAGAFWGQTPLRKNKLSKENIKGER